MGCEQVCLRWNNFPSNITKNIDELWKDESLVDVSILSDGQCVQAHKVILSAASPLLRNIFAVNPCQHPVIILQDVRFRELISIISFIYKGEINIEEENLPALLQAARTLQIRGLSDSVDRPNTLNRLYTIKSEDDEQPPRKRRNPSNSTSDPQVKEETDLENTSEDILPKENEIYPADFVAQVTEEDSVLKNDCVINEHSQEFLQTDTGQNDDTMSPTNEILYAPFACPFCYRSYTNWGFRRRHIKSIHCQTDKLTCRTCPRKSFKQDDWIKHMTKKHNMDSETIRTSIFVLDEAYRVFSSPQQQVHDQPGTSFDKSQQWQ